MRKRRKILTVSTAVVAAATLPLLISPVVSAAAREDDDDSSRIARLYAPPPDRDSFRQVARLAWRGDFRDSAGLLAMVRTPQAVWYGDETPEQIERLVRRTTRSADVQGKLPVLALYNIPGRDCGSYSSGGADGLAAYEAWIDAVAEGIGGRKVLIVLEPDSLALLPSDCADESNADQTAVEEQPAAEQPAEEQLAGEQQTAIEQQPAAEAPPTDLPPLPDPGASTAPPAASDAQGTGQDTAQPPDAQSPDPRLPDPRLPASESPAPKPAEAQEPSGLQPSASQSPAPEPSAEQPSTLPELPPLPTPDPMTPDPMTPDLEDVGDLDTPVVEDQETAARYSEINYAVDSLTALGNTSVYLDAGHAGWHSVRSIVPRLIKAGIDRATGFALNVSHYQTDPDSAWYGRLISSCLAYADEGGDPEDCADQSWSRRHARRWLHAHVPDDPGRMKHFVTDTSRNGQGPWAPRAGAHADTQSWCNPPARGLGRRPTTRTGDALLDAALWVKTPGESDGRCLRGTDGPLDPVRGTVNPDAGEWFPEQALELVRYAEPSVKVFRRFPGR
ncbi:glycoside hydrolase family 6 protein [Streptomyces violaceusniger]|uniref:glycoside hydrolase family 6 protein n=1 Tax=Streptomyces violaceusniger TaxID=68280 RepID=UPI00369C635A